MIDVTYDPARHRMRALGHDDPQENGDVCTAVSTLMYTLAYSAAMRYDNAVIRMEEGDSEVAVTVTKRTRADIKTGFGVIADGMQLLARNFPTRIRFRVI